MNRTQARPTSTSTELPSALALVVGRCLTVLDARRPDLARLAQIVELDPVLTGAALRIVRCPIYGGVPRTGFARSVESIGRRAMERVLRSQRTLSPESDADVVCRRWTHAIAVAAASRWISNQGMYEGAEEAYLAGLVHDIGRFVAPAGEDPRTCAVRAGGIVEHWRLGARVAVVARWHHAITGGVSVDSLVVDGAVVERSTARLLSAVARGDAIATARGFGDDEDRSARQTPKDPDTASVREAI